MFFFYKKKLSIYVREKASAKRRQEGYILRAVASSSLSRRVRFRIVEVQNEPTRRNSFHCNIVSSRGVYKSIYKPLSLCDTSFLYAAGYFFTKKISSRMYRKKQTNTTAPTVSLVASLSCRRRRVRFRIAVVQSEPTRRNIFFFCMHKCT